MKMNAYKIEIIVSSNNQQYLEECLRYIQNLNIPEGYELSFTNITEAVSMTAAYNEAMYNSDAKYKIYIHQDTFLVYRDLLHELIGFFTENPQVGMVGVLGASGLQSDGTLWNVWDCGRTRAWNAEEEIEINFQADDTDKLDIKAIDGMFMATQYDIKWRDDVISGWDFYDISQSCEFIKQGYHIAVPYQKEVWCLHDCGHTKLKQYDAERKNFCETYSEFGYFYQKSELQNTLQQRYGVLESILQLLPTLIEQNKFTEAEMMLSKASELQVSSTEFSVIKQMLEIKRIEEEKAGHSLFWRNCDNYDELMKKYTEIKFALRQLEYGIEDENSVVDKLDAKKNISKECLDYMIDHCVYEKDKVRKKSEQNIELQEPKESKLVSVIIPTYNRKHTIRRSVDSVLAQTYRAFEIIIVDDCSTDGTMEYVDEIYGNITDINIIYVRNDNNIGPSASRNIGVSYANGEYIAFHDSDDEWLPHKLERQMQELRLTNNKNSIVYSPFQKKKGEEKEIYPPPGVPLMYKTGYVFPVILINSLVGMITLLMRKDIFLQSGGFNEQLHSLEDYELTVRLAKVYDFLFVDEVLAVAYESADSVGSRFNDKIVTQYYIMDMHRAELGDYGLKKKKFDSVYAEAKMYGNELFFCQSVLQLSKDEDYLRYARQKWDNLHPSSHPEQVDTTTVEGVQACTGCMACCNECPVNAIYMERNREGFSVPVVADDQCIQCGKCKQVCPVCNETPGVLCPEECYAVMGSNEIRKLCSSGGVFGVLAEKMLEESGYVSGAVWDENWQVEHIVSRDAEDIRRMYSSKYVQSDIKDTYRQIRDLLENGQKVLFSGCGCQVAGLRRYLQKEYENLLTVDVVCHGVPSQEVWNTWLEQDILQSSGRTKEEIAEISFRKKAVFGWNVGVYIRYQDGEDVEQRDKESAYMAGFLNNWTLRECCYACQFKNKKYSDITLGDFWGINQIYQFDDELGTSFVTVNTTKGAVFFKSVLDRFKKIVGLHTASAVPFNPCISGSVEKPVSRDIFFSEWKNPDTTLEGCLQRAKDRLHFDIALVCMWGMNYGNAITNYALFTYIKKHGKKLVMLDNYCSLQPKAQFLDFAKAHYTMSSSYFPAYDYSLVNRACDAFLVCSDQVWNYAYADIYGYGSYFQLDFAEDDKKRVSYASSFGSPECAMPADGGKELYEKFDAISVRESFGVPLCKKLYDVDAVRVVDPVFLLEREDYERLLEDISETEPYIAVYMLNPTAKKRQLCLNLQQKLGGIPMVNLMDANPQYRDYGMHILEYDNIKLDLTVEEWLSYLRNASYVITDSFHGTCFAVIFGKRFATVKARESERFETFIAFPELEGRILEDGAAYDVDKLSEEIDYPAVYRRLEEEKEASKDFIKKYIL